MHPILFKIGDFTIGTYGVAIVVGLLAGLWLAARLARRRRLPPEFFYDLTFVLLLSGFLGARLFYVMQHWEEFLESPGALLFSRSGFVFLGGFLASLAVAIWFTRRRKMPPLEVADIVAPALALAHGFGRIGCFFAGCCFGVACPPGEHQGLACKLLTVQYPLLSENGRPIEMFNFAYQTQITQGLLAQGAAAPLPIVPVQLFESFGNFMICLILVRQWRRRRFSGQTFALYLILYGVLRFGLEYWRGDVDRGVYFGGLLSTSQIISIFTLAAALLLWWFRRDKGFQPIPEPAPAGAQAEQIAAVGSNASAKMTPASRSGRKRH